MAGAEGVANAGAAGGAVNAGGDDGGAAFGKSLANLKKTMEQATERNMKLREVNTSLGTSKKAAEAQVQSM